MSAPISGMQYMRCRHLGGYAKMRGAPPVVSDCYKVACKAFPRGIPDDITEGRFDHTNPRRGDHGIQFEPSESST